MRFFIRTPSVPLNPWRWSTQSTLREIEFYKLSTAVADPPNQRAVALPKPPTSVTSSHLLCVSIKDVCSLFNIKKYSERCDWYVRYYICNHMYIMILSLDPIFWLIGWVHMISRYLCTAICRPVTQPPRLQCTIDRNLQVSGARMKGQTHHVLGTKASWNQILPLCEFWTLAQSMQRDEQKATVCNCMMLHGENLFWYRI